MIEPYDPSLVFSKSMESPKYDTTCEGKTQLALSPSVCFDFDRSNLAKKKSLPKKVTSSVWQIFFCKVAEDEMNANWCVGPTQKLLLCAWIKYWSVVDFLHWSDPGAVLGYES
jgi:hypothetical protein